MHQELNFALDFWGTGHNGGLDLKHTASYSDYALRPGVGMYRDVNDLAQQIAHADLKHIHRLVAAWNSRYRDVLGEAWAKHFRRMFPGVERGEYRTPQSSTGDLRAAWHATTGNRWTPWNYPTAVPPWFHNAASAAPGDCIPPGLMLAESDHKHPLRRSRL